MDLLLEIDPYVYGNFVAFDKKGGNLLTVKCLDAIYGIMVMSLIY